jgi:RNA polymerase sigma-70 factor (ECF subfamily)
VTVVGTAWQGGAMTDPIGTGAQATTELDDFRELTRRYERELLAHCYRMSGSVHDAQDLVQETLLRAWKSGQGFEGRSSVRTWLHRIATNVCLTDLENRPRRPLPSGLGTSDSVAGDALEHDAELTWLEPVPDAAVEVAEKDTIRLAFVAALQHLPPRQRAVLVLRDVLRWSAKEVAEALEMTVAGVNSALQRAHATMAAKQPSEDAVTLDALDADQKVLLDKYVDAFWRKDVATLATLLAEDALWEMPPFANWYVGAQNIANLVDTQCPGGVNDMPMVATVANGQPAFGLYMRSPEGDFVPFHLQVISLVGDKVRHVGAFFDPRLFPTFGLPARLPADVRPDAGPLRAGPGSHDVPRSG